MRRTGRFVIGVGFVAYAVLALMLLRVRRIDDTTARVFVDHWFYVVLCGVLAVIGLFLMLTDHHS